MKRRIIINWQAEESRKIVPVGELLADHSGTSFEFGYIEGVRRARELGFQPFAAFPEVGRRYVSDRLFPFFRNRILPTARPDYLDYVLALGLNPETVSAVDLLGRSEGRRQTDRIETVLVGERNPDTDGFVSHFLVRGVRHVRGAEDVIREISPGMKLENAPDPTNPVNPRAQHLNFRGRPVGFIPDYLLADLEHLESRSVIASFTVVKVNCEPTPAHHRLVVRVDADWPEGFQPFSAREFQPVAPLAERPSQPVP